MIILREDEEMSRWEMVVDIYSWDRSNFVDWLSCN